MGEGFINWGYIVGKKNSMLDMKGLSFSILRLFDYPGDIHLANSTELVGGFEPLISESTGNLFVLSSGI